MGSPVYRSAERSAPCPRCDGRLTEIALHDVDVLDCLDCGGSFLPKAVVEALGRAESQALRAAFPERTRAPEATHVRYLKCPICARMMNRIDFAKGSRVIVDTCKDDGTWFDSGEVNAVIGLVERGDLERAEKLREQARIAEKASLRAEWRAQRAASLGATALGRRQVQLTPGERQLLGNLFGWEEG